MATRSSMSHPYSKKSARRSIANTVIYRVLSQVATLLGYVVMVRGMTEHDFGVFNILYSIVPVVSTVASLGLEQTLRRYQPEYLRSGQTNAAEWLVRLVGSTRFGVNVLVLGVMLMLWNHIAPIFQIGPYRGQFVVFCVLILLHFQARILSISLDAHMLHKYSVGTTAILSWVKLIAYSGLTYAHHLTLTNAILSDVAAYACAYVFLLYAHRRYCLTRNTSPYKPSREEGTRLRRYAFYNNFNDAGTVFLNSQTDNFFIAALVNSHAVGAYSFYTRTFLLITNTLPQRLFGNVIQPMFFSVSRDESTVKIPKYFTFLTNTTLVVYAPIAAFICVYGREIVQVLFGGKFIEEVVLWPIILLFGTAQVLERSVTLVAQFSERPAVLLWSKIFVVYNIVSMLTLIPMFGIVGAAVSSGSSVLFKNLFVWWCVRSHAKWLNFGRAACSTLVVWGAYYALGSFLKGILQIPHIAHMIIGGFVALVFFLVYVRSPVLSLGDRDLIGSIARQREHRLLEVFGIIKKASPSTSG